MPMNIIAVYDQEGAAHQVIDELVKAGCDQSDLTFIAPKQSQLSEQLSAWGVAASDASTYAEAVQRGKSLVRARVPDEQADNVAGILVRRGARKLADIQQELGTLRSVQEDVSIGKRQEKSSVAARTTVTEQPVEKTVNLREEKVQVESQPANRELSPEEADNLFQESSVEMSETREVPEIKKQARVTQEVNLKKEAGQREETVKDTVRRSDVTIERKEK